MKQIVKLTILKNSAIKLRGTYQLPSYLCYLILKLDDDCPVEVVKRLKDYSCHYLRVKGYYKSYPQMEKLYNNILKKEFCGLERNVK